MARIIQLDSTFTDTSLPVMQWLANYEAQIAAITGLAGWWDASSATNRTIATGVSQLTDRSGNGKHMVQATTGKQPPVSSAAAGTLIARDALSFDGSTDRNLACSSFFDGTGTWSYVSYFKTVAASGVQCPLSNASLAPYASGTSVVGYNNVNNIVPTGGMQNKQRLLVNVVTATDQYMECGDKTSTLTATYAAPANASALYIGEFQGSSSYKFNGPIFEALMVKGDVRSISGALALLRAYFVYKYER